MAHPFFDAPGYPWHRPEAVTLQSRLTLAFPSPAAINNIYLTCGDDLPPLFLGQAPNLVWHEALQNLTTFGALRKLLDLIQVQVRGEAMQQAVLEIINAQGADEIKIISEAVMVLDRSDLRDRLKELAPDTSPVKVLLVRGGPRTGKTWGRHIFERFAMDQGSPAVYLYPEIVVTVQDLIDQLFGALGALNEIPAALTTGDAWYRKVCVKLMEVARTKKERLWIAIDDLGPGPDGAPLMDGEVKRFCEALALNMLNPPFRTWFRIMLIHYPEGSTPTNWKKEFWTEDRPKDTDIKEEHVVDLLKSWALSSKRMIVEDDLKRIATELIAKADAPIPPHEPQVPRLERIHDGVKSKIKELAAQPPL